MAGMRASSVSSIAATSFEQQLVKADGSLLTAIVADTPDLDVANLVQIETAYSGNTPPSAAQSFVPRLVKGRQGPTLDSVREGLNRWHAANPGKLPRPVIETIWFEMAVPGLKK